MRRGGVGGAENTKRRITSPQPVWELYGRLRYPPADRRARPGPRMRRREQPSPPVCALESLTTLDSTKYSRRAMAVSGTGLARTALPSQMPTAADLSGSPRLRACSSRVRPDTLRPPRRGRTWGSDPASMCHDFLILRSRSHAVPCLIPRSRCSCMPDVPLGRVAGRYAAITQFR